MILVILVLAAIIAGAVVTGSDRTAPSPSSSQQADPEPGESTSIEQPSPTGSALPSAEPDAGALPSKEPLAIGDTSEFVTGARVALTSIESVEGQAQGPGEVAAPSLRVTLTVYNESSASLDLTTAVTTAFFGPDLTPAPELSEPGAAPLPANVGPGSSATGIFVFSVPQDERGAIRIVFDYAVDVPVTLFEGAID